MSELLTPDQYMDLLVRRREAYEAAHPPRAEVKLRFPALLDWFIEPGDEDLVDMTAIEAANRPAERRPKRSRRYRPASYWRAELERIASRMDEINGLQRHATSDPAAYGGIGIRQTARQARRYGERIDRAAAEYVRLEKKRTHATRMLRAARAREATVGATRESGPSNGGDER